MKCKIAFQIFEGTRKRLITDLCSFIYIRNFNQRRRLDNPRYRSKDFDRTAADTLPFSLMEHRDRYGHFCGFS